LAFVKGAWRILVAIKDGLVLLFLLLFFGALYAALSFSPKPVAGISAVALLLTELRLDEAAIVAALLHDTIEDAGTELSALKSEFGPEVADLVDGVTKLGILEVTNLEEEQAQSLRKMFLAMSQDIRVVLVKLADRLHNIRTAHALPIAKRKRFCSETLDQSDLWYAQCKIWLSVVFAVALHILKI